MKEVLHDIQRDINTDPLALVDTEADLLQPVIIQHRSASISTLLKDELTKLDKKPNYMTVPVAIRELEKIEMLKGADNEYNLDYAVTATQKTILNAFGMSADNIHRLARGISTDLARIEVEAFEKKAAEQEEGSV